MHPRDPNPPQSFAGMQRVYLEAVEIDNTDTKKKKNTQDKQNQSCYFEKINKFSTTLTCFIKNVRKDLNK